MLHVQQSTQLAVTSPDGLWMPWRPLATYLITGKHYHDEDGLHARQLTGLFPTRKHAYGGLPAHWSQTARLNPGISWGIAEAMQPAASQRTMWGDWLIYSFQSPDKD
jgi:hypothetical protein